MGSADLDQDTFISGRQSEMHNGPVNLMGGSANLTLGKILYNL